MFNELYRSINRQSINRENQSVTSAVAFSGLLENHPKRQDAFLKSDEAIVIGPVFLERVLDERQHMQQTSLVEVSNGRQHSDLHTS